MIDDALSTLVDRLKGASSPEDSAENNNRMTRLPLNPKAHFFLILLFSFQYLILF